MKPTMGQHNDFLAHKPIEGVCFEHNDYVRIVSGEHQGKNGSLVSVEELGEDPLFLLELDSGFDVHVRQSQIERADF
jgi:transcription elongation factor